MAYRKKKSNIGLWVILIFLLIGAVSSTVGVIQEENRAMTDRALNQTMAPLSDPTSVAVTGDKAICYFTDKNDRDSESTFSDRYVPEGYLAQTPEEARYILYCDNGASVVGRYGTTGGLGYKRWVSVEILDRTSNTTIASKKFEGSNPPSSSKGGVARYGSAPSSEKIENWILSIFNSNAPANATANTTATANVTVYAKVPSGWSGPGCWAWSSLDGKDAFDAWPGEAMTFQGGWYSISVPSWINYVIINANDGSTQTADLSVESGKDVWVVVSSSGAAIVCYEKPAA